MHKINIKCDIREYPDKIEEYRTMNIRNHWNDSSKVLVSVMGYDFTFRGQDIINAIQACSKAY